MTGDEIDVEQAFREHHDGLFRYLVRYCGDPQAARDAVQEAFVRLQERPPNQREQIRTWLYRTGLNAVRDHLRQSRRHRRLLEANADRVPTPRPEPRADDAVIRDEERRRVRDALDRLRERERSALLMREEGFKHREIAEALGTTTGTVGTLIARSLDKLVALLEERPE